MKSGWGINNWSDEVTAVKVTVLLPWWLSQWAYIMYIVLLFIVAIAIYQIRTRNLLLRAIHLEGLVEEKTKAIMEKNIELNIQKEQLEIKNQHISELISAKDQLFANISHELKTPITLITAPLKVLIGRAQKQEDVTDLNMIQRNVYRLLRMVDQLLELSTLQQANQVYENDENQISYIPLHKIINCTKPFEHIAAEKGICFEIKENEEVLIYCQQEHLEKIILNLTDNAIKYTLVGIIVITNKWYDDKTVVIKFRDTGIGIPEDEIAGIFDRFTRVYEVENQRDLIPGAGIGLSLVKELVELLSGKIEVTSKLGEGSEFRVYLPATKINTPGVDYDPGYLACVENITVEIGSLREEMQQDSLKDLNLVGKSRSEPGIKTGKEHTVLIIDDNADIRHYIAKILRPTYNILMASDGDNGIIIAEKEIPDLIILDVMMPIKDGFHVCQYLKTRKLACHIPIILLTALQGHDSRLRGLKQHGNVYMTKPFDPEELMLQATNLLAHSERYAEQLRNGKYTYIFTNTDFLNTDQEFLKKFHELISDEHKNTGLNVQMMADLMDMPRYALERKLKSLINLSPKEYLRNYRLQKARKMLVETTLIIKNIAYDCGFSNESVFSKIFKDRYGLPPKQYRSQQLKLDNIDNNA